MNLTSLLQDLGHAAAKLAPLIGGGGAVSEAVGLGHAVISAIAAAKAIHTGGPIPPEAVAGEKALLQSVTAHAQSTFERAEGG